MAVNYADPKLEKNWTHQELYRLARAMLVSLLVSWKRIMPINLPINFGLSESKVIKVPWQPNFIGAPFSEHVYRGNNIDP